MINEVGKHQSCMVSLFSVVRISVCARTFSFAAVALDGEAGGLLLTTLIRFVPVLLVETHTHTCAGHSQCNADSAHGAWNQPMLRWASNPPIPGGRALGGWQRARG